MTSVRPYRVRVHLAQSDRSTFLALVSALHRRAVEVMAAELHPQEAEPTFTATFVSSSSHARTVRATLCNLVDVLDVELVEDVDHLAPATPIRGAQLVPPVPWLGAAL